MKGLQGVNENAFYILNKNLYETQIIFAVHWFILGLTGHIMLSSLKTKKPYFSNLSAALGSALAMASVVAVGRLLIGQSIPDLLVASMGASAVLIFCVPQGELSGPWAVLGGHVISAAIGVTSLRAIADTSLAGVVAVGCAIFAMQIFGCLHPPGGATALSAVVGGGASAFGYTYVIIPVLLNVVVMLSVAYLFHLPKRAYPLPKIVSRYFARR